YITIEANRRGRIRIQYGIEDQRRSFTMEWQRSRCHFVQDCTERKQIGSSIQFLALGLLRGHVGDGSQRAAWTRQMSLGLDGRGAHGNAFRPESNLGQTKIQNLGVSALGDE